MRNVVASLLQTVEPRNDVELVDAKGAVLKPERLGVELDPGLPNGVLQASDDDAGAGLSEERSDELELRNGESGRVGRGTHLL